MVSFMAESNKMITISRIPYNAIVQGSSKHDGPFLLDAEVPCAWCVVEFIAAI